MFPPSQGLRLDIDAISQICGSVSIACWIVVFSPQIIENWRRSSADGLSVVFITIWLLGDFFNIIGAVLQGVLPTMIILAVYYTLADIVLLGQCFWYKGFTLRDEVPKPDSDEEEPTASEESPLLHTNGNGRENGHHRPHIFDIERRHSASSLRDRLIPVDGSHLSPVTPLLRNSSYTDSHLQHHHHHHHHHPSSPPPPPTPTSALQTLLFNLSAILLVCLSGVLGWYLSSRRHPTTPTPHTPLTYSLWGQISGYVCALLYLGSRIPQLLLNYRRKSTEGISMLFFLFACIGNAMYVLSILAYRPICFAGDGSEKECVGREAGRMYWRYVGVNASWLLGSLGTLVLDAGVFVQYFMYREVEEDESDGE
ncbi:PQ-loop-domain-containing protein, partial [Sporormia fimetaria CBS 119925]